MDINKCIIDFHFNKQELQPEELNAILDLPEEEYKKVIREETDRRATKHYLYSIIDKRTTQPIYYGITKNPETREHDHFSGSNFPLYQFMAEEGKENFKFEIVLSSTSRNEISIQEKKYITNTPGLLNLNYNNLDHCHSFLLNVSKISNRSGLKRVF